MSKPTTHVLLLVDDSGSMSSVAEAVRSGFNEYIDSLIADKDGKYRVTVGIFGHQYRTVAAAEKPKNVLKLDHFTYTAAQYSTALYDGIGRIVGEFDKATTLADDDKVILVIQTDGEDNSSDEFTVNAARQLIEKKQASGWSVLYLGAGPNAWSGGRALGVKGNSSFNTQHTAEGYASSYTGVTRSSFAAARGADSDGVAEAMRSALDD
jgi:uncharacterized protein YegL